MTFTVRPEARRDILDAALWYEDQQPDLGRALVGEIDSALERIQRGPMRYPKMYRDVRRTLVHRFPYAAFYILKSGHVAVIAVLHQRRDFKVLDDRLKG